MNKYTISFILFFMTFVPALAEAPAGYYTGCEGKSGKALLQQLNAVIGAHTTVSYKGLWDLYKTSDVKPNGKIWDMYSTKEWTPGNDQCGSYTAVGSCYNREHSFPKSWFDDASPMVSDAFHIYPTDGKVNGQRSNYPYGECANGTTLGSNGSVKALGKLGKSTFPGYSGTVFEPDDQYKGDFARSYFYMAACYNDRIAGWSSDMLARNNYPVFSTWAVNLLLKWHRQDPVSEKEIKRNEVVYGRQHNRNPFIDYPELAEHIWGNKVSEGWNPGGSEPVPMLTLPADGSTVDMGMTGIGVMRSVPVPVKGSGLSQDISVTVSGSGFGCDVRSLSAGAVNDGTSVSVTFKGETARMATGSFILSSGDITSVVGLKAQAVDGIPALPAFDVTETSFRAAWVNIDGPDAMYRLNVYLNGEMLDGFPMDVYAAGEWEDVDGLEPGTTYTYTLSYGSAISNVVEVTTAIPQPSIQFLFDGELDFSTPAGEPSDVAELLVETDNVGGDITVSVIEPFELSVDKANWSRTIILADSEDRMYMRLYGDLPGSFTTSIRAVAGDYMNDDAEASGTITRQGGFLETFETEAKGGYDNGRWTGVSAVWYMINAGVFKEDAYEGNFACRLGKDTGSSITTSDQKSGGVGTVSFMARPYNTDGQATIKVQYSTDGSDWQDAGSCTVSGNAYKEYTVTVNATGQQYIRLQQTSGKRVLIDNVAVSDYSGVGAVDQLYYHSWDACCRDHRLVIENKTAGDLFQVYGVDGIGYLDRRLPEGETSLGLSPGLYIVVQGDFSRRVLVK